MSMPERVKLIREYFKLNQTEFSKDINVAKPTLSLIERGQKPIRDVHVSLICKVFNVNEEWLRTGEGKMFGPDSMVDPAIGGIICNVIENEDSPMKEIMIQANKLDETQLNALIAFLKSINTENSEKAIRID